MKVGDKVICKYSIDFFERGSVYEKLEKGNILTCKKELKDWYTIGKEYKILKIIDNSWINVEENEYNCYVDFSLHNTGKFVWDYFYTKKEMRKLKLEKLN